MALVTPEFSETIPIIEKKEKHEMISISLLPDLRKKIRINSSSLSVIQECMRKAKYSLHEGWRSEVENPALIFGSAVHKALEVFYSLPIDQRYVPELNDLELMSYGHLPKGKTLTDPMIRVVKGFLDTASPLKNLPETDKRSLQNGVWLLHCYIKTFIEDPYTAYVDEKGPFLERTFSYVIYEDSEIVIEIFGTIDFLLKHSKSGDLMAGDHKTASSFGFGDSSYFDREKPNHQYTCYLLGLREVYGFDLKDFMVSIFEVKAKPKTSRGSEPSFPRQITSRNEDDFIEFKESIVYEVQRYLEAIKTKRWAIGHVGSCNAYGKCSYREVCSAPNDLRETMLSAKFVRE